MVDFAKHARRAVIAVGQPISVGGVSCDGVFTEAHAEVLGIEGSTPRVVVSSDIVASEGMTVVVETRSFVVITVKPDSPGLQRLILEPA